MAFHKRWIGTADGDYGNAANWEPISIRNPVYRWIASGSGTAEYYLDLIGGGDPGLTEPATASEDIAGTDTNMAAGTAGSLNVSEWDWADNDTLGYSTVYVRLAGGTDPDASTIDHVKFRQIPVTDDDVTIPATSSVAITLGLDQSAVAIDEFITENGSPAIATIAGYLHIKPNSFDLGANAVAYIDMGAEAISGTVRKTAAGATGGRGLYLRGTALATLTVIDGSVGVAFVPGELSTVSRVQTTGPGADVVLGAGCTLTTISAQKGKLEMHSAATTVKVRGAVVRTIGTGAITTVSILGGSFYGNASGTITTLNCEGGTASMMESANARTITNLKVDPGGSIKYDPDIITITNHTAPTSPVSVKASNP
mgnify:CR=1 FL=1